MGWDEEADRQGLGGADVLGLPPLLARCVQRQDPGGSETRTRQEGPAEAVEGQGEERDADEDEDVEADEATAPTEHGRELEEDEYNAATADTDMQRDMEKQFKRVEVGLPRWELRRAKLLKEEQAVREQVSEKYESVAAKEQLRSNAMVLARQIEKLDPGRMEQELRFAELPSGCQNALWSQ